MKTGTKSVLFGVHAFWWHPITVWLAWRRLYGRRPNFWESVAIFFHDIGYFGKSHMDDAEGEKHPFVGADIIWRLHSWTHIFAHEHSETFAKSEKLFWLVLLHSRYLSARFEKSPSDLCWADKLSMCYDPSWFYLLRARASGELSEYREAHREQVSLVWPDEYWFVWCRNNSARTAHEKRVAKPRNHDTI